MYNTFQNIRNCLKRVKNVKFITVLRSKLSRQLNYRTLVVIDEKNGSKTNSYTCENGFVVMSQNQINKGDSMTLFCGHYFKHR